MGLDWNPLARPKPGFEAEFERLLAIDVRELSEAEEAALRERFAEVSGAPFERVGAPRVGYDAAADDWLRDKLRDTNREDQLPERLAAMRGYYVLDLLPESPGFPIYTSM